MELEVIIGLETHIQLKTATKLFCSCSNAEADEPNVHICPICVGHPGTLPVTNAQAVNWAVRLGLALGGEITPLSKFDRKNYFYPDLPKAYQISQFDLPVMQNGHLVLDVPGEGEVTVRIERLHLEEDAAKNIHGADGKTYVDYNRGGTPLCEIVSRPDIHTAAQAKAYMQEMRLIARTLGVSDGDLERGHMRCDVNISLRPVGDTALYAKTEIKNVNSFRHVERAIAYEIKRQTELWEAGTPPTVTVTRGWNDAKQITEGQREKESSSDYRYFPEPDIPPLDLRELTLTERARLPELPRARRSRFVSEYGMKPEDARQIVEDPALADFTDHAMSELAEWAKSEPDIDNMPKLTKLFTGWLLNKLMGLLEERKSDIRIMKISPENFAEFITLLASNKLTGPKGLEVLAKMLDDGSDPEHAMTELGATRLDDQTALQSIVESIIADHPTEVGRYRAGEEKLLQFFLGQAMKVTRGNADPGATTSMFKKLLS